VRTYKKGDELGILELMNLSGFERNYQRTIEHWLWKYEGSQFGHLTAVAEHDRKIVGTMGLTLANVRIQDKIVLGCQAVDLVVHPKFRGQGIFLSIGRFLLGEAEKKGVLVTYGFPNEQARSGHLKYGWFDVCGVPRLVKPLNMNTIVNIFGENRIIRGLSEYKVSRSVAKSVLQNIVKMTVLFSKAFNRIGPVSFADFEINQIDSFDSSIDSFWEEVSKDYAIAVVRDKKYLNWRYFECPNVKYAVFIAKKNGEITGYIVLRYTEEKNLIIGHIVDILAPLKNKAAIQYMISRAIEYFKERNVDLIVCWMLKSSSCGHFFYRIFRNNGFIPILGQSMRFMARANSSQVSRMFLREETNWYVTKGDSDQI
jgi:GNAT superfamily N-acetyltransferase